MGFDLRKKIFRSIVSNAAICFGLSLLLSLATGGKGFRLESLMWLLGLAALLGLFSGWREITRIKTDLLKAVQEPLSYLRLQREAGDGMDWATMDDYAVQLATRGYTKLGDFTYYPPRPALVGAMSCFIDQDHTTIVEVQLFRALQGNLADGAPRQSEAQFMITSLLDGQIHVISTDMPASALPFLLRGNAQVFDSYSNTSLLGLVDQHDRQLRSLQARLGKSVSSGLTMLRYVLAQRALRQQALQRLQRTSAYQIVEEIDALDQASLRSWASASETLQALPPQSWQELEQSVSPQASPAIVQNVQGQMVADDPAAHLHEADLPITRPSVDLHKRAASDSVQDIYGHQEPSPVNLNRTHDSMARNAHQAMVKEALMHEVERGANWFYWIAGLSLVNLVIALLGANWAFLFALGSAGVLSSMAQEMFALYFVSLALIGFIGACGYLARRPSTLAFMIGMAAYLLDGMLLLYAQSWLNLLFHGFAFYGLWNGWQAARNMQQV